MRRISLPRILALAFLLVLVSGCNLLEERRFVKVLERQHARYPIMQLQDVYKLVHQATMLSEHAVVDSQMASKYLLSEVRLLRGENLGPLCDPISPSEKLVRINLGAFNQTGEDPKALASAFVKTAYTHEGSVARLERFWGYAESAAAAGKLPYSVEEMQAYFAARAAEGHAPVHHSQRYRSAYQPAYRVVKRKLLWFSC